MLFNFVNNNYREINFDNSLLIKGFDMLLSNKLWCLIKLFGIKWHVDDMLIVLFKTHLWIFMQLKQLIFDPEGTMQEQNEREIEGREEGTVKETNLSGDYRTTFFVLFLNHVKM